MASYVRISLATVAVICGLGLCRGAQAQGAADKAAAEALFDRGLALMKDNKYQEACERLEQSQAIERGIGTMLYLAECYEKIGRSASAWALFREAASSAQAAGQTERADAGRRRAEKLEKTLSRLTIEVPSTQRVPGLVVKDNGSVLQPVVFGTALPVDPGVHRVEASAPGYLPWSKEVKVDDHAASLQLEVPALAKDPNAAVAAAPSPSETASAAASPPAQSAASSGPPAEERMSTLRIVGIALGSAGIVGMGVGAVLGGLAMSKGDDVEKQQKEADTSDDKCPDRACAEKLDDARKQANASTALWIVGGALLAGGIITFVLAPKYQDSKPTVAMYADPRGAGLSLRGAF